MTYISDPELISRLNAKAGFAQSNNAITDPDLINRLNQQAGFTSNNSAAKNLVSQITAQQKPSASQQMVNNIISPEGREGLKKIAAYTGMIGTSGIGGMAGTAARLGAGAGAGAILDPEDRMKGAETGLGFSALGEAAPFALSGVGKIAELINPVKYAGKLGEQIKNTYNTFKTETSRIYNDLRDRYQDKNIYEIGNKLPSTSYLNSSPQDMNYVNQNATLKRMHNAFLENPTYENAHDLQSQMGSYSREIKKGKMDANDINTVDAISNVQGNLQEDMGNFLKNSNPLDYSSYQQARSLTRDVLAPHDLNDYVSKVARGRIKDIDPNDLLSGIKKAKETGRLPQGHYLEPLAEQLKNRVERGGAINDIGSLIGGGVVGEMMMPGGLGAGAGVGAGAAMAKFVNPVAIRLAQNPYFINGLKNIGKGYDFGKNYLISQNLEQ